MTRLTTILREWGKLVTTHAVPVAALGVGLTLGGVAADLLSTSREIAMVANFSLSLIFALAQSWLTLRILTRTPAYDSRNSRPRVVGLVMMAIPVTLGILAGILLLVLPGLYLAARWSASSAILIGEDTAIGEAMTASWRLTRSAWLPIAGAVAIMAMPLVVMFATLFLMVGQPNNLVLSIVINALGVASNFAQWVLGIAVYLLLRGSPNGEV